LTTHGCRPTHIIEVHPGRIGQRIMGAEVIAAERLPAVRDRKIIVSVAGAPARREIRERLGAAGFVELRDFVCAAYETCVGDWLQSRWPSGPQDDDAPSRVNRFPDHARLARGWTRVIRTLGHSGGHDDETRVRIGHSVVFSDRLR
jgi:hypothetical protein